jgi:hypothetical protein
MPGRLGPAGVLGAEVETPSAPLIGIAEAVRGSNQALASAMPRGRTTLNIWAAAKEGDRQTV